ncbi:MAG TPA: metallophosphoesterase [Nitrososphaeraceae archaeon]|nr:metallophosphoesterase [Nitrososphaeraceae archaeon]
MQRSASSPKYFFGEPLYVTGEIDFKNPNRDEWRYKELGFSEMSKLVKSVPDPTTSPPRMNLGDIIGNKEVEKIQKAGRIVFHSVGDTGAKFTKPGLEAEATVTDKMAEDFNESNPANIPSFLFHLGDVVYNFGEDEYYYDQFYEPFRNYQAPIFAIPGNHDGITYVKDPSESLQAFRKHFCDNEPHHALEAGGLTRTTMTQPGVYFTLKAPFVTIIGWYSNVLEDPGVISSEDGKYPNLDDKQKDFLESELRSLHDECYSGAVILAVHHPPYTS